MNEQEIRYYLLGYITEEMKVLDERELAGYGHEFSKRFHRKMKKIFWGEKYFGKHLHLAYAVRKIAAVVVIVAGLFAANQVSAKIFGINPWKYITSYVSEYKMESRSYKGLDEEAVKSQKLVKAKKKVPSVEPEGMPQTVYQESKDTGALYLEWKKGNKYLQYMRTVIHEGEVVLTDAEYTKKEVDSLCGYECTYYTKGDEMWIAWDDAKYSYQIDATNIENPKELLKKMAEDIYK